MSEKLFDNRSQNELNTLMSRKTELEQKIQNINKETKHLKHILINVENELKNVKFQYEQENRLNNILEKKLDEINKSRSWKLSKPIRKIGSIFKNNLSKNVNKKSKGNSKGINIVDARKLEKKLIGGYSSYAIKELIKMKEDYNTPLREKVIATRSIIRWYYNQNKFSEAYEELEFINKLNPRSFPEHNRIKLEIKLLKKLNEIEVAKRKVWKAINSKGFQSEFCLGMAHLTLDEQEKLNWYNLIYDKNGYTKIDKINKNKPLNLSNIYAERPLLNSDINKYKVSVIIPAYNAGELIHIPLKSLLNQSIQNLEIIVVDDCSTDNTANIVSKYVELDNRVKLIRKDKNEGAYAARNTGLQYVTGDFITVHDSDDWSHPQKIEVQLQEILDNPGKVASISHLVRVDESITPINPGSLLSMGFIGINTSSLLFNKSVISKIGGWDSVRVGADTEYLWRIQKVFGEKSVIHVKTDIPFSLSLSNENSLTGTSTTHVRTIHFGLRRTYREAMTWWHNSAKSKEDLYMDPKKINRHFPCPVPNLINNSISRDYDYIIVADFSMDTDLDYVVQVIKDLSVNNKLAIFHWPDYEGDPFHSISDRIFELIHLNNIDILVPNENIQSNNVLILTPKILNYVLDDAPNINYNQAYIVYKNKLSTESRIFKENNLEKTMKIQAKWINANELHQKIR